MSQRLAGFVVVLEENVRDADTRERMECVLAAIHGTIIPPVRRRDPFHQDLNQP